MTEHEQEVIPTSKMWWAVSHDYNGDSIQRTKDCDRCPFKVLVVIDDHKSMKGKPNIGHEPIDACVWGMAWKRLSPVDRPRTCEKLYNRSPAQLFSNIEASLVPLSEVIFPKPQPESPTFANLKLL